MLSEAVISRSLRYHNPLFPWKEVLARYGRDAVFVGHPEEHRAFTADYGPVPLRTCRDLLEVAQVIKGSWLFIGNQSAPAAIALGCGVRTIMETVCDSYDNCDLKVPWQYCVRDAACCRRGR